MPFIEAAAGRGLSTVVFDVDSEAAAKAVATEFVTMSTHDTDGVIAHLERTGRDLVGCFAYSSYEGALRTATAVVDRFGVRGLTTEAFTRTSSKLMMRYHLTNAGILVPDWERISDPVHLEEFISRHGRVMVKPARGSVGSEGVAVLEAGASDATAVLSRACDISSDQLAIVESYIDGAEYTVDGFVLDGEVHVLSVGRKHSGGPNARFVVAGYVMGDSAVHTAEETELESLAAATVAALAMDNTYFSLDVLTADGVFFVIDAGPLLDAKIDRLLHHAGVNVYDIASGIAVGGPILVSKPGSGCHGLRFLYADRSGILGRVMSGRFTASDDSGEIQIVLEMGKGTGDGFRSPQSVADVLGWVCASGTDADGLWSTLARVDLVDYIELGSPV